MNAKELIRVALSSELRSEFASLRGVGETALNAFLETERERLERWASMARVKQLTAEELNILTRAQFDLAQGFKLLAYGQGQDFVNDLQGILWRALKRTLFTAAISAIAPAAPQSGPATDAAPDQDAAPPEQRDPASEAGDDPDMEPSPLASDKGGAGE